MSIAGNRRVKTKSRGRLELGNDFRFPSRKRSRKTKRQMEALEPRVVLAGDIVISEFMAANENTLADEDGTFSDWIELHNTTASPINLTNYYLTDDDDELNKWQFPNVTIGADQYLVVFASGKDKRDPLGTLHTNFKLGNEGEYLALIKPDFSVEYEYAPDYPEQQDDISYGFGQGQIEDIAVGTGAAAKFLVPTAATPANWNTLGFNDASWQSAVTGIGYQNVAGGPPISPIAYWTFNDTPNDQSGGTNHAALTGAGVTYSADIPSQIGSGKSLSFSGASNQYAMINPMDVPESGMTISMWFKTSTNSRGLFSVAQGNLGLGGSDRNLFFTGSNIAAQLKGGVTAESIASSGQNYTNGAWHHLAYVFQQGQTTQRIYIDGNPVPVATGTTASASILTGQDRVYIGMSPPGLNDWFNGQIDDVAIWGGALSPGQVTNLASGVNPLELLSYSSDIATSIDGAMKNVNSTSYLRIPFNVSNLAAFDALTLQMKYDDGFVAYLNGTKIAERNAPAVPAWNSAATQSHPNGQAAVFESIDVSAHLGSLQSGANVLAIQGLNLSADNVDFLISPRLVDFDLTPGVQQYYTEPTPGGPNSFSGTDLVDDPLFSKTSSVITGATQVTISSTTPGAQIYYTTNGSSPTQASTLYTGPITVSTTTQLRARAYKDGFTPSNVSTQFFTLAAADVLGFTSDLPVIVVDTFGGVFGDSALTPVTAHFLEDPGNRTTITGPQDIAMRAGMRLRGQSSQGFAKKQYAFETWDERNEDRDYSILGFPEESDWIIYGPYAEKAQFQNPFIYELSNEIGDYAVRTQYVEMFLNTDGTLTNSDYVGMYVFMERIKRDDNRVNIDAMGPNDNTGSDVTGGYIFSFDKDDPGVIDWVQTSRYRFHMVEPDYFDASAAQRTYLTNYLTQFETALYGANFTDPNNGYAAYIEPQTFINHHLLVELAKNIDGYRISTFYNKDRDGKIKMGPVWDYNLSMSNANYLRGWDPAGWYDPLIGDGSKPYFTRLFQDPNFSQQYVDSYFSYRDNLWSTERLLNKIDDHVETMYEAVLRDHARWGRLGVYDWPNIYFGVGEQEMALASNNHPARTYRDEVQVVRQWLHDRIIWMDSQFLQKPFFSQNGGNISPGFQLTMSGASGGTLYYTLDGTDPRLPGGGIKPGAQIYSGPITINANTRVTARLKNNTATADLKDDWSAPTSHVFVVDAPDLIISEIMYNPAPSTTPSIYVQDDFEFIEVQNAGATPLNLNGYKFTNGINFAFPNTTLNPGQTGVVVRNAAAFATRHPGVTPIGTFTGTLDNGGENLKLVDNIGVVLFDGNYDDDWQPHTDGNGYSLVTTYQSPGGGPLYNAGEASDKWRASQQAGGNPGAADTGVQLKSVLINEIVSNGTEFIELHNTTGAAINVGGWYLSDDSTNLTKYQITAGTTIPANGYLALTAATHFGAAFNLSDLGETLFLSSNGPGGTVGGYRVVEDFGAADPGIATGRYIKSTGRKDFVHLVSATPGAANSAPLVNPVAITEIMYHTKDHTLWLPALTGNQLRDEFIEIQNTSGAAVNISGWQFTNGVTFTFPAGQTLAAGERALIVAIDPNTFRAKYFLPGGLKIYGPYTGNLDDGGEELELSRPGTPVGPDTPLIRVDRVTYDDDAPWSKYADGVGSSLSRVNVGAYGNDVANWQASHNGGTPGAANTFIDLTPPTQVSSVSTSQTGVGTQDPRTNVSWTAASDPQSGIAYYNIYRKGSAINPTRAQAFGVGASTGLLFVDNTVFQGPAFQYQVAAVNNDGVEGPRSELGIVRPAAADDNYTVSEDTNLVTTLAGQPSQVLISAGSVWQYLVTGTDPGPTWNDENIDEGGWAQGPAELGFNVDNTEPLEATVIGFGGNAAAKYSTTYFRHRFNVTGLANYTAMTLKLKRDDGAAVWVNGVERIRNGLPGNPGDAPTAYSFYSAAVGDDGSVFNEISFDPAWLHEGFNTIAVEIHQGGPGSSDLSFDLALEANQARRSGVLANDNDNGNPPLTATKLTDPTNGTITQFNPDGTFTYVPNQNFAGVDTFTYKVTDGSSVDSLPATVTITVVDVVDPFSTVAGRHVFYNNSKFDGDNAAANASDDAAIATDKVALLPGQTAGFVNYTSFNRGLNGIMVDIAGLPAGGLSASDFEFKVGNDNTPGAWTALAAAPTVSVRTGAGTAGSDRVTLVWPAGAALKQWLQVTVKANANTGLATPDVFYFGNAVGESLNVEGDYSVSITDELLARNNPVSINPGTTVINRFDYNRDGTVSVVDQLLARNNITTQATKLKQIIVPSALSGSGLVAQGLDDSSAIARGLAASGLGSSSGSTAASSSGGSAASGSRLQAQALSAAYAEGESLLGKRRVSAAADVDSELLELIAGGK